MPPRPKDPRRIRIGSDQYEVDPDWSYYGSLIFTAGTGEQVGWINARSQTGWQVFHTQGHLLGVILLNGQVNDFRGAQIGQISANEPTDAEVLSGLAKIMDSALARFE